MVDHFLGKQINVTLFDFGILNRHSKSINTNTYCDRYAVIRDSITGEDTTICGGEQRINQVYVSSSNVIDITIHNKEPSTEFKQFILKYEGK